MIYSDAVKLLSCSGKFRISLGLERISSVLDKIGNPQDKLKCIHVAGTNGKGSVCAIIDAILIEAGKKTGLYTSPHIFEYTERIKISGRDISKENFAEYVDMICTVADENGIDLTEFEILTAVMFKYFADNGVDVVILETGLGGRYDATNVIKSNLCAVITHIDYDHTDRLGDTLEKIAYEKAGIIKPNCPVITSQGFEIFKDTADSMNSLYVLASPFEDISGLSLKGLCQKENLSLAVTAVNLAFSEIGFDIILNAIKKVNHPFRFQYFPEKNMIIDASHNPNGVCALRESLDFYYPNIPKRFIFGCLNTKNYQEMIKVLFRAEDEIYFYNFNYPNSATVQELQSACPFKSQEFKNCFDYTDGKLTVVCGSFYMLKELLEKL